MSEARNINDVFFEGTYKTVWKKINPPGLTVAEADFIEDVASLGSEHHVLDLMCGFGRHTLELAKRNIRVTAVDNLPEYINELKTVAKEQQLPVEAICSGVLDVPLKGIFDAAICMGNSLAFFNRQATEQLLHKISLHLRSGAVFIINTWMIAEIAIRHFREKEWYDVEDYKCLIDNKYCFLPSRIESEQTVIAPDGSSEVVKGVDYIFTLGELEEMFQKVGLQTKALFSTPRKRPFYFGDTRIYIVAEKFRGQA
ncbi:MAG TPA: class I SAM-dependent methyltransferase [Flavisolibacter sp.]|nr:class I SAM-dependent methyltransferase [Flavisolibacter sp.]